jgi:hypothetical protein
MPEMMPIAHCPECQQPAGAAAARVMEILAAQSRCNAPLVGAITPGITCCPECGAPAQLPN